MTGQHWHAVIRVWATAPFPSTDPEAEPGETEEGYVWRHDGGTVPVDTEPAVLVATLRALAADIEQASGLAAAVYEPPPPLLPWCGFTKGDGRDLRSCSLRQHPSAQPHIMIEGTTP